MNNKNIEDLLRKSWSVEPPEGMRNRILCKVQMESQKSTPAFWRINRWKLALVSLAIAIIVFCNISDNLRSERIAEICGGTHSKAIDVLSNNHYFEMRRQINDLLASADCDNYQKESSMGDKPL